MTQLINASVVGSDIATQSELDSVIGTVSGINKSYVGLGNVDNTSDLNKPVSTATTSAIGSAVSGITKTSLGLSNVDNTSDTNKPISTLTATALSGKQATLVSTTNIKTVGGVSILGSGDISVGGTGDVTLVGVQTLTNKRITSRVGSVESSATPTINTDSFDVYRITALTTAITSMTSGLTGTPLAGDALIIEITGTAARAIAWGASFEASTVALPTTTVTTAMLTVAFLWNAATSKWRCVGVV